MDNIERYIILFIGLLIGFVSGQAYFAMLCFY